MFLLGHTGIGTRLAAPFTAPGQWRWVLLGTLLPDLIDKPLYYGLSALTGRRAADLGLVSGTRTVGHTLLLLLLILCVGRVGRRRSLVSVALGMSTHLMLDALGDLFPRGTPDPSHPAGPSTLAAILFPLLGPHFPVMPFRNAGEQLGSIRNLYVLSGEIVGAALWLWMWQQERRRKEAPALPSRVV